MKILLLTISLMITNSYAFNSDDLLHPVAHGAGSYLLTHSAEVACRKVSNMGKTTCSIIGGLIATTAGIAVELTQHESNRDHAKSLIENGAGVVLAIGVIHLDF